MTFTVTVQPRSIKLYWAVSPFFGVSSIERADLDGSNVETLITRLDSPNALAIHDGKMYWSTFWNTVLQRANLDGSRVETIVTNTALIDDNPTGIAIHDGKIYWSDRYKDRIRRANLDGSNVEDFIDLEFGEPEAISIHNGVMYVPAYNRIWRANLNGSNFEIIVRAGATRGCLDGTRAGCGQIWSVAIHGGKLYWTVWHDTSEHPLAPIYNRIQRANLDGSNVETLIEWPCPWVLHDGVWQCDRPISRDTTYHDSPNNITIHNGKMYWTNKTDIYNRHQDRPAFVVSKLRRSNLDGSNVETLVIRDSGFGGIAFGR